MNKSDLNNELLILLGNQLFPVECIAIANAGRVFMAEDLGLCTYEKHHKLKILMFLAAMREKRDELKSQNIEIDYLDIEHPSFDQSYEEKLAECVKKHDIAALKVFEIEDKDFELRIQNFAEQNGLTLTIIPSPMFLLERPEFSKFSGSGKVLRMGNFYKEVRKKLDLLLDEDKKTIGWEVVLR